MEKIKIENHTLSGGFWLGAWLFVVGLLHLAWPQVLYAIILWPYYLGQALSSLLKP